MIPSQGQVSKYSDLSRNANLNSIPLLQSRNPSDALQEMLARTVRARAGEVLTSAVFVHPPAADGQPPANCATREGLQ